MVMRFEGCRVMMGFEGLGGIGEVGGVIFDSFYMKFFVSPNLNYKTNQCRITSNIGHYYVIWLRKC